MVNLLLDSSFLMMASSTPVQGFEDVADSLGRIELVVLDAVIDELRVISGSRSAKRAKSAGRALEYASTLKVIPYREGEGVDDKILNYARSTGAAVATLDSALKRRLRAAGVVVVFRRGCRLVVEGAG